MSTIHDRLKTYAEACSASRGVETVPLHIARDMRGDLIWAVDQLQKVGESAHEERAAWDMYAASAMWLIGCGDLALAGERTEAMVAKIADLILAERRKRFGGARGL